MYNLPSADTLISYNFELNERDLSVVQNIAARVNEAIDEQINLFKNADQMVKSKARFICLCAIKFYMEKFSRTDGQGYMIALPLSEDTSGILITRRTDTIENILYYNIILNLSFSGIFTEYWQPITCQSILHLMNRGDRFGLLPFGFESVEDDVLERSFEENREFIQDELYSENRDNELVFSKLEPLERNEDNKECGLCCCNSDYVCEKCHYPLCNSCIGHLKHSTNSCPSCRSDPIILRRIKDGTLFKPSTASTAANMTATTDTTTSTSTTASTMTTTDDN